MFADELASFLKGLQALGVKQQIIDELDRVSKQYLSTAESIGLNAVRMFPPGTGRLDSMRLKFYEGILVAHLTVLTEKATGTMPDYSHLIR